MPVNSAMFYSISGLSKTTSNFSPQHLRLDTPEANEDDIFEKTMAVLGLLPKLSVVVTNTYTWQHYMV